MSVLQNFTPFTTVKYYMVTCKYKMSCMHLYLGCYFLELGTDGCFVGYV